MRLKFGFWETAKIVHEITAQSGHPQVIATLRCSFTEADIGNGAQQLGGVDGCNADLATFAPVNKLWTGVAEKHKNVP